MMELRVNTLVLLTNSQHDEVIIFPVFYRDFSTFTFLLQHLVSLTLTDFFFFLPRSVSHQSFLHSDCGIHLRFCYSAVVPLSLILHLG